MTADPAALLRLAADDAPDADLLARFAAGRDEGAFAALVRRHGGTVLGVCRRMTGHRQDAEDAFQAVFLVLARKADRIDRPELLGNWLYGVAVRVAGKARRRAGRWREATLPDVPQPEGPTPDPDLARVIDEELARLPVWYRDAVLLCDLHGLPRSDAAKRLGVPEGTLSSRLAAGRKRLADRLARRGVTAPIAGLAAALGGSATADVPAELVQRTVSAAVAGVTGGAVPAAVLHLATGGSVMGTVFGWVGATAAVGLTVGAVAAWPGQPPKADVPKPAPAAKTDEPKPATSQAKPDASRPGGRLKLLGTVTLPLVHGLYWHPDGTTIAVASRGSVSILAATAVASVGKHASNPFAGGPPQATSAAKPNGVLSEVVELKTDAKDRLLGFHPKLPMVVVHRRTGGTINAESKLVLWQYGRRSAEDGRMQYSTPTEPYSTTDLDPDDGSPLSLSPDGRSVLCLATRDDGRQVLRLVDSRTGVRQADLLTVALDRFIAAVFTKTGDRLVVLTSDYDRSRPFGAAPNKKSGTVAVESVAVPTGQTIWRRTLVEPTQTLSQAVPRLVISPDGSRLLATFPAPMAERDTTPPGPTGLDVNALWEKLAEGKDRIDLKDPKHARTRQLMQSRGEKLPDDGQLTKDAYRGYMERRLKSQRQFVLEPAVECRVLDTATGADVIRVSEPAPASVGGLSFSHDGRYFVGSVESGTSQTGGVAQMLRMWDAATGAPVKSWKGNADALFAPDRPTLLISEVDRQPAGPDGRTGSSSILGLWDVAPLWK
ncbi:MAG: sigma-70 family RNA polymerase sigma factor [Gemmataceae bacterium]